MSNGEPANVGVLQRTLDLMVLQTLGYPALMRPKPRGLLRGTWGTTDNNRRARFSSLTQAGCRRPAKKVDAWDRMAAIMPTLLGGEV